MKRMRDDAYGGSQFKRPFVPSRGGGESYGQSQLPGGGGGTSGGSVAVGGGGGGGSSQKLTTNDALSYLKEVKDMFQDQRDKYDMFLEVMKDFKAQRTDTTGVIARVKELFKGHNNLIFGFNTFLPKGYEITLIEDDAPQKKAVEFDEAINFVNKIKRRFHNDEQVYKAFLDILNMYRKEHKDINEVFSEVAILFEDHSDLRDEFKRFLPDTSGAQGENHAPLGRNSIHRYTERSTGTPTLRQMQMDKPRWRDRIISSHCDRDLSVDRPEQLDDDKMTMKMHKDQRKRSEKELRDRRNRDQDDREPEHDNNRDLQRFSDKRKSARKIEGLGANSNLSSFNDKEAMMKMCNAEIIFFEKVKDRLGNPADYQAFLKVLNIFSQGIIKKDDLENLVTDLLGKYADLMGEFNDFLERCENIDGFLDGFLAGVISTKSVCNDGQVSRTYEVEDKEKEHRRELEAAKEKERCREKYMGKSIQELDLSECERCTPSYRLLPNDYPIPIASQRSELGTQLLNDHWVSVTSGSEDYSFKHMRRNQYEESLFRCEDDRFELDMLLESVSSTAKRADELLNLINENKLNLETPFCIEDNFSALNLRCIERLYGDHGLDVLDILRKNPAHGISVLSIRLKQKQEEWTKCRLDFNKVWAEIYAKNHYKSLDHRSFYFKQQDSKSLSPKSLVAEIKELKEKQQEDDVLLAISAGNRQPAAAHLDYEYTDINIHEDLYKLIHFSCEEVCSTKEQLNKVMRLWTTFLEPMLGVPSRPNDDADGSEDVGKPKAKSCVTKGDGSLGVDATLVKQPKSSVNGDEINSTTPAKVGKYSSANGDISVKEEKEQKIEETDNKISGPSTQVVLGERVGSFNASLAVVGQNTLDESMPALSRANGTATEEHVPVAYVGAISPSKALQGVDATTPVSMANGMCTDDEEKIILLSKIEKEEGGLSPTGDFEEDNVVAYGDAGVKVAAKAKPENGEGLLHDEEAGRENDADDEDCESASEAGDDASGSESAGDECSQDEVDGKAESEGEAKGMADAHFAGDAMSMPISERFVLSVKPLAKHVKAAPLNEQWKDSRIFYGNDDFFALFKLYQILYDRIFSAKTNTAGSEMKRKTPKDARSSDPYGRFMAALYDLLDGSAENATFEDECRDIIGNQSYVLFTLDKLIFKLVKQLVTVATDEMDNKLLQLHEYENSRGPGKFSDSVYHENARVLLHEENLYRLKFSSAPSRLTIQLMDNAIEKPEMFGVSMDPNFAAYLYNDFLSVLASKKEPNGIALQRNKRKHSSVDEYSAISSAMDGVQLVNCLECKIACNSYKISYVLDTEDFFFRPKRRRKISCNNCCSQNYQERMKGFDDANNFLLSCISNTKWYPERIEGGQEDAPIQLD